MGNIFCQTCLKVADKTADEHTLLSHDEHSNEYKRCNNNSHRSGEENDDDGEDEDEKGRRYYKSIIDDAQTRFLSQFTHPHIVRHDDTIDEVKQKLSKLNITESNTYIQKQHELLNHELLNQNKCLSMKRDTSSSNDHSIIEILSTPTMISYNHEIDRITDDIADIISNYVTIRHIQDSASTVVSFKGS